MTDIDDLTSEQIDKLVRGIQDAFQKQARRNRIHISNVVREMTPPELGELTCCGANMEYKEAFGVRRYTCTYRPGHPARYVRQSDGEMLREENL